MRVSLAVATLALAAVALAPAASAALTVPKELCHPGQAGVCHWYTPGGNQCAYTHAGTMFVGVCTTSEPTGPVVCTTIQAALWDGWCWTGEEVAQNLVGDLFP